MKAPYKIVSSTIDGKRITLEAWDCHNAKSQAGRLFQSPTIKKVKVADRNRFVYLRLSKNKRGKVLQHLTINVPSELAPLG